MSGEFERLPENADGPYYVDERCTDCDTCRCISPDLFRRNLERGYSYLARQPTDRAEKALVEEARDCCPAEAIRYSRAAATAGVRA